MTLLLQYTRVISVISEQSDWALQIVRLLFSFYHVVLVVIVVVVVVVVLLWQYWTNC